MTSSLSPLLLVANAITAKLPPPLRFARILEALNLVVPYDAAVLLALRNQRLFPIAAVALRSEALGLSFAPHEHPRLSAILQATEPLFFSASDPRPDPFDGFIDPAICPPATSRSADTQRTGELAHVHSCAGCPLIVEGRVVGALAMDAIDPSRFDKVDVAMLAILSKLTAAAMHEAELAAALEATREHHDLVAQHLVLDALERHGGALLGQSDAMAQLRREIDVVAASDLSVLVQGETGTGKELVVRTVHALSRRANQPMVHVNCAALPESIAESELFGHEKGAFTGATSRRPGKFEIAHKATIFLDEIGELPLSIQPKLLRFLQFGEIQRVGADHVRNVNVRVIAATNRELDQEVKAGRFRADLYHRLSVYPIHIAPLRQRSEDILMLAGHLLDRARLHLGLGRIRFTDAARARLHRYDWPGNIRELEHVVTRGALRASGGKRHAPSVVTMIDAHHIDIDEANIYPVPVPSPLHAPAPEPSIVDETSASTGSLPVRGLKQQVDDYQRRLIESTVQASGGNWSVAARHLQVDRGNLHRLAKRLGVR